MRGSFRKRSTAWEYRIDLGKRADGSRIQKTKGGFKTKKEAEKACAEMIAKLSREGYVEPSKSTLEDLINAWLEMQVKPSVKISTYDNYSKAVLKRICPVLGHLLIKDIKSEHIKQFYKDLTDEGLTSEYIRYIHAILNTFFKYEVEEQHIAKNPVERATPPKIVRKQMETWDIEQTNRFLGVAKKGNRTYYMAYLLALFTGMRRGEILALRWKDCDLENGKLSVCQSLYWAKRKFTFMTPKTRTSVRMISIPESVVNELNKHRIEQNKDRLALGEHYEEYDLVIAREDGQPVNPRSMTDHFRRTMKLANVPKIRFHDTRHTHATLMLRMGQHIKVVADRLGHTNASMTLNVYSHATMDMQQQAIDEFDKIMKQSKATKRA